MDRFEFKGDPAWVSIGDGLSLGFGLWKRTAGLWALAIFIVGVLNTLYGAFLFKAFTNAMPANPGLDIDWMAVIGSFLPGFIASTLILGVVAMVARWVYLAIAISALRGTPLAAGWIVGRGLRSLAAELLVSVVEVLGIAALFGLAQVIDPTFPILLGLVVGFAWIWVSLRLRFWTFAIFDGAGIGAGAGVSWAITKGGLLTIIGWTIALMLVGIIPSITISLLTTPLGAASPFKMGIQAAGTEAFSVFTMFVLAVLYESRRRLVPVRFEGDLATPAWAMPPAGTPFPPTGMPYPPTGMPVPPAEPYDPNGPTPPPPPPPAPPSPY